MRINETERNPTENTDISVESANINVEDASLSHPAPVPHEVVVKAAVAEAKATEVAEKVDVVIDRMDVASQVHKVKAAGRAISLGGAAFAALLETIIKMAPDIQAAFPKVTVVPYIILFASFLHLSYIRFKESTEEDA